MLTGAEQGEQFQVGADQTTINREALSLILRTEHIQPGEGLRVFPDQGTFVCDGSINSLIFIAETTTNTPGDLSASIRFSAWEPVQHTGRVFRGRMRHSREVRRQDLELISQRNDIALYRAVFPSLDFRSGDVLAIDHSPGLAIQYAYNWGPENYVFITNNSLEVSTFISSPVAIRDYPLLAVEDPQCNQESWL